MKDGLIESADQADEFFGNKFFAGGYQQAMQAMATGLVDAAGASQYADLLLTPKQQSEVTWIADSKQIPSHVVIARSGLGANVQAKFVEVMLSLNTAENRQLLSYLYGPDGYVVANVEDYDDVRMTAKRYGYIK